MAYLLDPPGLDEDIAEIWADIRDRFIRERGCSRLVPDPAILLASGQDLGQHGVRSALVGGRHGLVDSGAHQRVPEAHLGAHDVDQHRAHRRIEVR